MNVDDNADNVDNMDIDNGTEGPKPSAIHKNAVVDEDPLEEIVSKLRFSINRIDLRNPPLPFLFGKWNTRPLERTAKRQMIESLTEQGILWSRVENMIPLIIDPSHVDPSCIQTSLADLTNAPMLKLTEEGMAALVLTLAGGRHRYEAMKSMWEAQDMRVKKLKDKLAGAQKKLTQKTGTRGVHGSTFDKLAELIRSLKDQLAHEEQTKIKTIWLVDVYDLRESFVDMAENYTDRHLQLGRC
jgi:hypothetical protein